MAINDNQYLLLLVIIPIFSAIFISRIPHFDMSSVRQIVTTVLVVWLAFLVKCGQSISSSLQQISWHFNLPLWLDDTLLTLSFGQQQFILLFALWCAVFSLFFLNKRIIEKNGLSFSIIILLLLALSTLVILSSNTTISIITANLNLYLFLYLAARFGGSQKGQAVLISSLFFLTIDIFSLAVLFLPTTVWQSKGLYLYWIALAPALARLLIPFFAPFSRTLFYNCSITIIVLYIAFMVPTGAALLFQIKTTLLIYQPATISSVVSLLVFGSIIFSVLWSISEKDSRQMGLSLLVFYNAIFIGLALTPHHEDLSKVFAAFLFCTIICASFTLLVGQWLYWERDTESSDPAINYLWFASLMLWFPLPGFGMGTALWQNLPHLFLPSFLSPIFHISFWLAAFLLLTTSLIQNYFQHIKPQETVKAIHELRPPTLVSFKNAWLAFVAVLLLCFASSTYFLNTGA